MTTIEWTDKTVNPLKAKEGGNYCEKISPGCAHCFASELNSKGTRFGGNGKHFNGARPDNRPEMTLNVEMLQSWARMRKSKKIFVGSMTDIFGEWVDGGIIFALLDAMARATKQTFQILTKRPERMAGVVPNFLEWFGWPHMPPNIWLGISAEDQQRLDERLPWLIKTQAVRFLSLEPLLGPIILPVDCLDWVIVGGESGPGSRPLELEWIEDILRQCREADIPAFVKQLGWRWAKAFGAKHNKGGNPDEWPPAMRVRMFPGEKWMSSGQRMEMHES